MGTTSTPALLGIQDGLESCPLHRSGDGDNNFSYGFCINGFKQAVIPGQDRESIHLLPDLLRVVVRETDQEERLGTQVFISLGNRFPGFSCPDDQHPAQESLGGENLDINQPPEKSQDGCESQEKANAPNAVKILAVK